MVPTDGLTLVSSPPFFPPFPTVHPQLSLEHDVDRRCRRIFNERRRTAEASLPSLRHVPRFHWVRRVMRLLTVDCIVPRLFFDAVHDAPSNRCHPCVAEPPFKTDACFFRRNYVSLSCLSHVYATMARSLDSFDSCVADLLLFNLPTTAIAVHFAAAAAAAPCFLPYCCSCFAVH